MGQFCKHCRAEDKVEKPTYWRFGEASIYLGTGLSDVKSFDLLKKKFINNALENNKLFEVNMHKKMTTYNIHKAFMHTTYKRHP